MTNQNILESCTVRCWLAAAAIAVVTTILLMLIGHYGFGTSLFLGVLIFVGLGLFLDWLGCDEAPQLKETSAPTPVVPSVSAKPAEAVKAPVATPPTPKPAVKAAAVAPKPEAVEPKVEAPAEEVVVEEVAEAVSEVTETSEAETTPEPVAISEPEETADAVMPAALKEARSGGADDLKKIKGIGPKLEQLCNELGFFHFDQIAGWTASEVAWMDENLKGFKGRVTRDNWVAQAAELADGGETEFSKRVDKGGVY